jgi:hypothetical protein
MGTKKRGTIDPKLLAVIAKVTKKRPRTVLDHIVKHGFITTEELQGYGYNHPPRAARDVREEGVPLVTFRVTSTDGRSIGAYKLGDPKDVIGAKLGGRSVLSKETLDTLYAASGGRCFGCFHTFEKRYLTIDHRIPYEIAGETAALEDVKRFMLLCGTCQRKKSWSCENCPNWVAKETAVCGGCIWARPEDYTHVATAAVRRAELVFQGEEVAVFDALREEAAAKAVALDALLKARLFR